MPVLLAAAAAAAAWSIGHNGLWSYLTRDLSIPRGVVVAQIAAASVGVAAVVSLARAHLVTGHPMLATLPLAWTAMEFLVALPSRHGAAWLHSRMDTLAVQLG